MIYKNNKTINEWYFNDQELIKVYKNGAICYYKIVQGATPSQEPCFAVVDNIQSYSDTEFIDVYDKATEKWYKLNNLDQYEEYGVYGEGRNITYYEGKLTIDNGYEYEWDGSEWDNLGEVSGSTATLPDVPFTVNINAKNYNETTKTFAKTNGQLADTDIVITSGTPVLNDGYVTVSTNTRGVITGYQTYFNRDNSNPNLTIISKQSTVGSNCHIFANRDSTYNWMYRAYNNKLSLHGANGEIGNLAVTTQPVIESVRVNSSRTAIFNNYTDNTTISVSNFNYGGSNTTAYLFYGGYTGEYFVGDFYWLYMSQTTLTDEQIQQVITYNEGGIISDYPKYYTEKDEPENNVVFTDMEDALAYQCPWVGMDVTIDNTPYLFGDAYEWLTKYGLFEVSGEYICYRGDKYEKMEEMVRNLDGTWSHQTPIVYEKGDLIEADSPDCALPYDAEIEYLESDGASYINTGIYLNTSNFEIGYECAAVNVADIDNAWGYAHQMVANGAWVSVTPTVAFFGKYTNSVNVSSYIVSGDNTIKYTNSGITVNGTTLSKTFSLGGVDNLNSVSVPIFSWYDFYSRGMEYSQNLKYKSFYIKNNDLLVFDAIPVRVGQVGYMYDRVSGQLFANDGTGSFIIGPDVQ